MARYVLLRLTSALPALLLITMLVFLVTYLIPGDPTVTLLGMEVTSEVRDALRVKLGLDRPVHVRYAIWLWRVLQGDLGESIYGRFRVTWLIGQALPVSVELMLGGLTIALVIAVPAALVSVTRANAWLRSLVTLFSYAGLSMPAFWLAIMLMYIFAVRFRLFPATGYVRLDEGLAKNLRHMVLPSLTLGLIYSTGLTRFLRANLLAVLHEDYVRTARMKGVSEARVLVRHVMKNALVPFVTVLGFEAAALLGGAVFIENVFALPGMGRLAVNAILQRDYVLVQGVVLVMGVLFVAMNLLVDIICAWLDPRIRLGDAN
ncbi:MAG: ABC transporter permease [Anaerolineae bacterium]